MDISFKNVNYTYQLNTPIAHQALKNVNFSIQSGAFTCVAGQTGSGKSTMVQLINGLLRPTTGEVKVGDAVLTNDKSKSIKELRQKVGMVFQYPEHQLFEETVKKDILFGPKNFGIDVMDEQVEKVIRQVGLNTSILEKSPFELSGGQMRRVAIASVLILNPSILILDEPTAGLDPLGQQQMMELFQSLHHEGMTILMISHHMEHALHYANQMLVFEQGQLALEGSPYEVFSNQDYLETIGLGKPEELQFVDEVNSQLGLEISYRGQSMEKLVEEVMRALEAGEVE